MGATRCTEKPSCGPNDYFMTIGDCDAVSLEQKVEYKWIEPKICKGSVLPGNSKKHCNGTETKPGKCPPGMSFNGRRCKSIDRMT